MPDTILEVANLFKKVDSPDGELILLDDVSFSVPAGTSVAITGPSGAGKSTLLGLLAGLDVPSSGSIKLSGTDITAMNEEQRAIVRAQNVGFVFQSFQLLGSLTALENVALPLELAGKSDAVSQAQKYLDMVGLAARRTHYPKQLSGGEQQRVAIARAFACSPKILFADEPTANLDQATGKLVSDLLFSLNDQSDTTLVLVTHESTLAARCAMRLEIDAGRLVQ